MSAGEGHVYHVHLVDPGGAIRVHDVPSDSFEATERGRMLNGSTIVPWHRVARYVRDITQPLGEPELSAHSEIRVWLDDGSEAGETLRIRADRFDPGPWTVDFLEVEAVNVEGAIIHMRKVHVPWGRVLEYERVRLPVEQLMPAPPG
jgi:alkylated DNA nucleotide flippase Atl1